MEQTSAQKVGPGFLEQRASTRVPLEVRVDLETDHNFYTGLTQDIGSGGVFVATKLVLPVGHRLHLQIGLPGATFPLGIEAEVRWARDPRVISGTGLEPGLGLKFVGLTEADKTAIEAFIDQRESLFYDDE